MTEPLPGHSIDFPPEMFRLATKGQYPARSVIAAQGEQADRFFFLESGRVKISMYTPEGFEKILVYIEPGQVFGEPAFFRGRRYWDTAQAVENSTVYSFDHAVVAEVLQRSPDVINQLARSLSAKIRMLAQQTAEIAFDTVDQRVMRTLADLALRHASFGEAAVVITHEQLANWTSTSRVTVARILKELEAAGLIQRCRGKILIPDPLALLAGSTSPGGPFSLPSTP
ncbi:MAG TPA: Crp/Fnr family transcriptional regulator [Symbiobacteriaceae bacterium]|nr:Crp/Fnr family transcriptional regulator [Symbiobacteriaceae bacterium]